MGRVGHDLGIHATVEGHDPVGVARPQGIGEDGQALVVVGEPGIAAVDPPAGNFLAVALPVFACHRRPALDEVIVDGIGPAERFPGLGIIDRAVAGEIEHERDLMTGERLVQILDQIAGGAGLARLITGDAVEGGVGRDHGPVPLHDGEDHVAGSDFVHGGGEGVGIELGDALVPGSLSPQAMELVRAVLQAGKVVDEHAVAGLVEPVGSRIRRWLLNRQGNEQERDHG